MVQETWISFEVKSISHFFVTLIRQLGFIITDGATLWCADAISAARGASADNLEWLSEKCPGNFARSGATLWTCSFQSMLLRCYHSLLTSTVRTCAHDLCCAEMVVRLRQSTHACPFCLLAEGVSLVASQVGRSSYALFCGDDDFTKYAAEQKQLTAWVHKETYRSLCANVDHAAEVEYDRQANSQRQIISAEMVRLIPLWAKLK